MLDSDSAFLAQPRPYAATPEPGRSSLGSYLRAIRRHPLLIASVVAAAFVGSLIWTAVRSRQYHATAQILVTPLPTGSPYTSGLQVLRDSADPTMTIETAAALVRSPGAATLTASRLGRGWTADRVLLAVSVVPQGETDVLDVTASAGSAGAATRMANTFASASLDARAAALHTQINAAIASLSAQLARLGKGGGRVAASLSSTISTLESERQLPDPSLSLAQPATAATTAGPSTGLVIGLAVLCGLLVALAAAVLLEAADSSLRDEEELGDVYPAPVLARVRSLGAGAASPLGAAALRRLGARALRGLRARAQGPPGAGAQDRLSGPLEERATPHPGSADGRPPWVMPAAVSDAFRSLLLQLRRRAGDSQVVMVTSAAAGDGRTASAIGLAAAAAATGRSVLLLDLDLRRPSIASRLALGSSRGIDDLSAPEPQLETLVEEVPGLPTLGVIAVQPGADDLAHLGMLESVAARLPELIVQARECSDLVVVDSPPLSEAGDALRLLDLVDDILLVVRIGRTPRSALRAARELLLRAGRAVTGVVLVGAEGVAQARYRSRPGRAAEPAGRGAPPRQSVLHG